MNKEIKFWLKVFRNASIMSVLFFISVWATGDINWALFKSLIIFFLAYSFTELARHYGLKPSINKKGETLIFT